MFDAESQARLSRVVADRFGGRKVLVVGDLMLDAYVWGDVGRVSPEAPVLVVRLNRRTANPGGAGNVLMNLARLGLDVHVAGMIGQDEAGGRVSGLLREAGVDVSGLVASAERPTTTKTRVLGGHQQVLRLDEEAEGPINAEQSARLLEVARERLCDGLDAVILSDYAKGVLTPNVCQAIIGEARERIA